MTDRELMQMALDALDIFYEEYGWGKKQQKAHEALRARLAQPEPQEIKIEFKEWVHPHMGLVPVDPKTPLILKAVIREEA
jgi:hypothetical protein